MTDSAELLAEVTKNACWQNQEDCSCDHAQGAESAFEYLRERGLIRTQPDEVKRLLETLRRDIEVLPRGVAWSLNQQVATVSLPKVLDILHQALAPFTKPDGGV